MSGRPPTPILDHLKQMGGGTIRMKKPLHDKMRMEMVVLGNYLDRKHGGENMIGSGEMIGGEWNIVYKDVHIIRDILEGIHQLPTEDDDG